MPRPTEGRISWFEQTYRVQLPREFKELVRTHNGGVPNRAVFWQNGRERLIERFLPILDNPQAFGKAGWYDVSVVITQIEDRLIADDDLIGCDVVPVAALFGGDFLCLDYRGGRRVPRVAAWDHERSDEGAPDLTTVASSFAEMLELLRLP